MTKPKAEHPWKKTRVKDLPKNRRKKTRTAHTIDRDTTPRDEALARADLVGFLTKRGL
jgi:hypothetical protein